MKSITTNSKILLLIILLSHLVIYLESCKKANPVTPPVINNPTNTIPILTTSTVGNKLVGSGAIGNAFQGRNAISADGNTLVLSGYGDNNNTGAIWIFNRTNNAWNQVAKLVGSDAVGKSRQNSVAISADGKTVIVGGQDDNLGTGAAWIFTQNNGIWAQQGSKLVGTGAVGYANQGSSVSISGDGNTVVIGGAIDNGVVIDPNGFGIIESVGATWIFTRNNGIWAQQGSKLVGTGAVGKAAQGSSVSISGDGNTVVIGGNNDNGITFGPGAAGAAWVFTRNNGIWAQQGSKLVGTGAVEYPHQGIAVSISGDGNSLVVGGPSDNYGIGAVWIFTRNNGIWAQQGSKLVGTGADGKAAQGSSVSISGDGNTFVIGGSSDNKGIGAAWIFTRNNGMWEQQGSKLVGLGAVGNAYQGHSVSISSDGNSIGIGGSSDNNGIGAVWIFYR